MASTYTPIATTTLGSAAASYTFSSIPSTYTDLVLIVNANSSLFNLNLRFNSDSSSLYSDTIIYNNGNTPASARDSGQTIIYGTVTTGAPFQIWNIMNYANTSVYKTVLLKNNDSGTSNTVSASVGLYRSTNAINAVNILPGSGNLPAGSTFTLYGIKAA